MGYTNLQYASMGLDLEIYLLVLDLRLLSNDAYQVACAVPDGLADGSHGSEVVGVDELSEV